MLCTYPNANSKSPDIQEVCKDLEQSMDEPKTPKRSESDHDTTDWKEEAKGKCCQNSVNSEWCRILREIQSTEARSLKTTAASVPIVAIAATAATAATAAAVAVAAIVAIIPRRERIVAASITSKALRGDHCRAQGKQCQIVGEPHIGL